MQPERQPFDFRKFFTLLGLMGGMLVFTIFMLVLMVSLYDWFGWWGVGGLLLALFALSILGMRRLGARAWPPEAEAESSTVEGGDAQPDSESD